ncbi:MAG: fumarylacetoacetate hydrolase family protein [Salibacteraceae bacterium]
MNFTQEQQKAASILWEAQNSGELCSPVREIIGEADLESAYTVQRINTGLKLKRGEQIIGAKIGLTNEVVQKQLGVNQPDYGVLTDAMLFNESNRIPWSVLHQPKVEAEIAFVLGQDITEGDITLSDLKAKIASAVASIEVVGSRIKDWNIRITDTIADNASASHFVLGAEEKPLSEIDLEGCKMVMKRGEEIVSEGFGKACMGNPLNALLWLAQTMVKLGTPLRAGDVVLAGALGPMVSVQPGDEFNATIEGLGTVSVSFDRL